MKKKYILLLLVVGILSTVGYRHPLTFDATVNKSNSLSSASRQLLTTLNKPLKVELFTLDPTYREHISNIIALFQKENKNIQLSIHKSLPDPSKQARFGLEGHDYLLLTYGGETKAADIDPSKWNEQAFTNLLYQILKREAQWVVFLSGHGEQSLTGDESRNLNLLYNELNTKGFQVATLNLGESGVIPDNTQLLIIADLKAPLLPQETHQILDYLKLGKNLLWLANPYSADDTKLANALGIEWQSGVIQDPKALAMGTPDPAISLITEYPEHSITNSLSMLTVFPWSRAIEYKKAHQLGFKAKPLLVTNAQTTLTQGEQQQTGPFTIGVALTKDQQRILVMGNTHFLSNAGLNNYGNLGLTHNLFHWLNEADILLAYAPNTLIDLTFTPSRFNRMTIQYVFPYCLSLVFFLIGWIVKRSRYQKYHPR